MIIQKVSNFNFPLSPARRVDIHHESGQSASLDFQSASLPPRYRRQWNNQRLSTVVPRNDIRTPSHHPTPQETNTIEVIDLTEDTDTEDDNIPLVQQLDNEGDIDDDSNSDSDSNGESSVEMIPLLSQPTQFNVSAMPLDLEHLNASARGVMNTVHTTRNEIKQDHANPRRNRLASSESCARHTSEGVHVVPIPKAAYNTARRILIPESLKLPLVTVSMRADVQFFHQINRYRLSKYSLPNEDGYRHVVDAMMISDTAIVAYGGGPTQISLLNLTEGRRPSLVDLTMQPHTVVFDPNKHGGTITCLSPHPNSSHNVIRFFTGGFDRTIRFWSINPGQSDGRSSTELFRTSTIPEALAFRRSRRSMLVATSKKLLEIDIDHLTKQPMCIPMSNGIHQVHVHKEAENITILEVDSLDHQIHLYDDRTKSGFDRTSDCYFGRRGRTAKHSKGDTRGSLFAKGFHDGTVCVWDLRNIKHPILRKTYHQLGSVIHTTFLNMNVVCYGKNGLTFLDIAAMGSSS